MADITTQPSIRPVHGITAPLNQILYGPPGTGKTYDAVRRAIRLCDGSVPEEDRDVTKRLHELMDEGRVAMATFHQSFGYEDFVEGIRPVLKQSSEEELGDEEVQSGHIKYVCKPGVFREICKNASGDIQVSKPVSIDPASVTVWKMSLGDSNKKAHDDLYYEGMQEGKIYLGYGGEVDYTDCSNFEEVLNVFREKNTNNKKPETPASFVNRLKNEMKIGDLVVVSQGNTKFRAIGQVTGEYHFDSTRDDFYHTRTVDWLFRKDDSLPVQRIRSSKGLMMQCLYRIPKDDIKWDALQKMLSIDGRATECSLPHVLIIDELNRANVSKVFGELITLLEADKRLGNANELKVKLPYSRIEFGVPSNLYVIGTMNTADRSIALIDTALRRRFDFEEIMPSGSVIQEVVGQGGIVGGVDIALVLETLNQRIELLYDRDHKLGHSFFLMVATLDDLKAVFLNDVIPMLQEYFYGDWPRIAAVLGCSFDPDTGKAQGSNSHPVIEAQAVDAVTLLGDWDMGVSAAVFYRVSDKFKQATGAALAPYFDAMVAGPSQG